MGGVQNCLPLASLTNLYLLELRLQFNHLVVHRPHLAHRGRLGLELTDEYESLCFLIISNDAREIRSGIPSLAVES